MTKTRFLIENSCYHIYSRGNNKKTIFIDENDFQFYLKQIKHYKRKYLLHLFGYCLMANHVHFIVKPTDVKKLPRFMQCLQRSYTAYFSKKYGHVGHLWQGRFQTRIMTTDQYLTDCISYVEYNPVRVNISKNPADYEFSSYRERILLHYEKIRLLDPIEKLFPS